MTAIALQEHPLPPPTLDAGAVLAPTRTTVRPTSLGRIVLATAAVALLVAWFGGGVEASILAMTSGALCIVSWVATRRHGARLRIGAPPPATAIAGERFVLDVPIVNTSPRVTSFDVLVSIEGLIPGRGRVGALLPRVDPGAALRVDVAHPVLRRGLRRQGAIELASSFPLGLWTCRIRFEPPHEVLVLPRLGTLRRADRRGSRARGDAGYRGKGRGDEQEVYGVRDLRPGEPLRAVHWKVSARRGRLLVREFRNEPRPPVHVVLSTSVPDGTRRMRNAFEQAVSLAATLVEDQTRNGHAVRLTLLGRETRRVASRRGRSPILALLRALAECAPTLRDEHESQEILPGLRGEQTYVIRVADGAVLPQERRTATVYDVTDRGLPEVFDRRRQPGREGFLGVRR